MDAVKTGELIAQVRKEKELTQKNLAEQLHVSVQAVSKWERGLNCPDIALLEPLAETLELTVTELLAGQRGEEPKEETVRSSLRFGLDQLGPKIRRWKWRFVLAALALAVLLAGLGCWWVRNRTELLSQPETILTPIDLEDEQNAIVDLLTNQEGTDFLHMYRLTLADDMDSAVIRAELWTPEGMSDSWELFHMSAFRSVQDFTRDQLLAFRLTLREDGSLPFRIRMGGSVVSGSVDVLGETSYQTYLGNGMSWNFAQEPTVVDREEGAVLLELCLIDDPTVPYHLFYQELREGTSALVVRLCWT